MTVLSLINLYFTCRY